MENLNNNTCIEMARLNNEIAKRVQEERIEKQRQELEFKAKKNMQARKDALDAAVKSYTRSSIPAFLFCNREELRSELCECAEAHKLDDCAYLYRFVRIYRKKENRSFLGRTIFGLIFG